MLTAVSITVGMLLALAVGGSVARVAGLHLRWLPALVAGAVLQAVAANVHTGATASALLVGGSHALLAVFALVNLRSTGMPLLLAGLLCNAAVMGVNGGMPVSRSAVAAAGRLDERAAAGVVVGPRHHLAGPSDRLRPLADVIPLPPIGQVLSVGDVLLALGAGHAAFGALTHRRSSGADPSDRGNGLVD